METAFAALAIQAGFAVPLVKESTLIAVLTVHSATPRKWTEQEIALAEEVAERTWAAVEVARSERALREREDWPRSQRQALTRFLARAPRAFMAGRGG